MSCVRELLRLSEVLETVEADGVKRAPNGVKLCYPPPSLPHSCSHVCQVAAVLTESDRIAATTRSCL